MPDAEKNAAKSLEKEASDPEENDIKSEYHFEEIEDSDTCKWQVEEIEKLIDLWAANIELISARRNASVMQKIATVLGGTKDVKQVRLKVKKLRAKFTRERERKQVGKPVKWRYYQKMSRLNLVPNLKDISECSSQQTENVVQKTNDCSVVLNDQVDCEDLAAGDGMNRRVKFKKERPAEMKQAINDWRAWNAALTYPLSEQGLHQLINHGFRDPTHIQLLVDESLEPLQLIYHDKLALKHALANEDMETHYQVIQGTHGSLIEVQYVRKESDVNQAENSKESTRKDDINNAST